MRTERHTVLVITETLPRTERTLFDGIAAYARKIGRWRFVVRNSDFVRLPDTIQFYDVAGIVGDLSRADVREVGIRLGLPMVGIVSNGGDPQIPLVCHDDEMIGRLVGDHLALLGLERFYYIGPSEAGSGGLEASARRFLGYADGLALRGLAVAEVPGFQSITHAPTTRPSVIPNAFNWVDLIKPQFIRDVVGRMEKPAAVFAFNDELGMSVVEAAIELDIGIPGEVAVVGADNWELLSEFSEVQLTSVDTDLYRLGYEGISLLHQLISATEVPNRQIVVPPRGLIPRDSSDLKTVDDPDFTEALAYMREHGASGISVKKVAADVSISRISLERACRRYLGHSPAQELRRIRMGYACKLLAETDLKIEDVATRCGFAYAPHFFRLFKNTIGIAPGAYRSRYRRLQFEEYST